MSSLPLLQLLLTHSGSCRPLLFHPLLRPRHVVQNEDPDVRMVLEHRQSAKMVWELTVRDPICPLKQFVSIHRRAEAIQFNAKAKIALG